MSNLNVKYDTIKHAANTYSEEESDLQIVESVRALHKKEEAKGKFYVQVQKHLKVKGEKPLTLKSAELLCKDRSGTAKFMYCQQRYIRCDPAAAARVMRAGRGNTLLSSRQLVAKVLKPLYPNVNLDEILSRVFD